MNMIDLCCFKIVSCYHILLFSPPLRPAIRRHSIDAAFADLATDGSNSRLPRFRKRDKMLFYGRRMLRKVKTVSAQAYGGQGRKRRAVMRFAKRILQLKREHIPMQLKTVEPPAEYLEEMTGDTAGGSSDRVPPEALYMLQGIRIFGHFEKPIFLKLCRHTEVLTLQTGELLFQIGDIDDSVFIVQSGQLNVLVNNADGSQLSLKHVKKGESVTSLLSFIDVLVGNTSVYKSVTAKAVEPSQVIRLPMRAFKEVFDESPDLLISVIQVIMIRLQRVTFTALRNYLGLHSELVLNQRPKRNSVVCKTSPLHRVSRQERPSALSTSAGIGGAPHQLLLLPDSNYVHSLSSDVLNVPPVEHSQRPDMLADLSDAAAGLAAQSAHSPGAAAPPQAAAPTATTTFAAPPAVEPVEANAYHDQAVEGFARELGLGGDMARKKLLADCVEVREAAPGVALLTEGKNDETGLVYVLSGSLSVMQRATSFQGSCGVSVAAAAAAAAAKKRSAGGETADDTDEVLSHNSYAGEVIGGLAVLTGEASLYTVRAKQFSRVALLKRSSVYK